VSSRVSVRVVRGDWSLREVDVSRMHHRGVVLNWLFGSAIVNLLSLGGRHCVRGSKILIDRVGWWLNLRLNVVDRLHRLKKSIVDRSRQSMRFGRDGIVAVIKEVSLSSSLNESQLRVHRRVRSYSQSGCPKHSERAFAIYPQLCEPTLARPPSRSQTTSSAASGSSSLRVVVGG
jgi:hypothetical protein